MGKLDVTGQLIKISDPDYKSFQASLLPGVDETYIIGVRVPVLRKFAKDFAKTDEARAFMGMLPHKYYDENNLHALLIEQIKNFDECLQTLDRFLPYVDNWATCDMLSPKVLNKNLEILLSHIDLWLSSTHTFEVRFGILCLMRYFLDEHFNVSLVEKVISVNSEEYYINMARAWYLATALAKQWDAVIPYISNNRLDRFTHNKTIQKALDSYRISDKRKQVLRKMKI